MLNKTTYFIREHVGMFKLTDTYDIIDPDTQQQLGLAQEKISGLVQVLRLLVNKRLLPTTVNVYEGMDHKDESKLQVSIYRPFSLFRNRVEIRDKQGKPLGYLMSKMFSIGPSFLVFDTRDQQVALVKGDWKGWNFRLLSQQEQELGTITKKWAGLGKELFTSADNYMISLNQRSEPKTAALLLAACLAVDIIYNEK